MRCIEWKSSSHLSSSHLAESSSYVAEYISHVAESNSHLAESSNHVVKSSSHVTESSRIKQVFYGFLEGFLEFVYFLRFFGSLYIISGGFFCAFVCFFHE
jgi:hypothetical protein